MESKAPVKNKAVTESQKFVDKPKTKVAKKTVNNSKTSAKPAHNHTMEFVIDDVQLRQLPKTLVNKIKIFTQEDKMKINWLNTL